MASTLERLHCRNRFNQLILQLQVDWPNERKLRQVIALGNEVTICFVRSVFRVLAYKTVEA